MTGPSASGHVFVAGTHGYHTYRIPAVVAAADGTLLAFAEGRRDGQGDAGAIDVVLRRSADGGQTWEPLQVVSPGGGHTVGNPSPVVDPRTGDVVLVTVRAAGEATEKRILSGDVAPGYGRRVWTQRSADAGLHWTAPVDVTAQVKRPEWRWYATGPGHAIALRNAPHAGRLVLPANHSAPETGYGGHLLLSDDGGRTWRIGAEEPGAGQGQGPPEPDAVYANESSAAELPDGRIYVTTRNQHPAGGTGTRAHARSGTGGESFEEPYRPVPHLAAPVVQCSVLAVGEVLVFAGPSSSRRERLAVRTSGDVGRTWSEHRVLWPGPAAYSDLVDLGAGVVGVLHENGERSAYERISFARVDLAGVMDS